MFLQLSISLQGFASVPSSPKCSLRGSSVKMEMATLAKEGWSGQKDTVWKGLWVSVSDLQVWWWDRGIYTPCLDSMELLLSLPFPSWDRVLKEPHQPVYITYQNVCYEVPEWESFNFKSVSAWRGSAALLIFMTLFTVDVDLGLLARALSCAWDITSADISSVLGAHREQGEQIESQYWLTEVDGQNVSILQFSDAKWIDVLSFLKEMRVKMIIFCCRRCVLQLDYSNLFIP